MAAVIGALRADLSASVAQFEQDMGKASKAIQRFARDAQRISQNLEAAGQRMTLAITAPFVALMATSAKAAAESRDAIAQVESRLQSMGNASGKTSEQLQDSAKQLQRLSTFDDDDILRNVTSAMLTFGNVSGEAFDRGQRAAVDMATSLGTDLQSAAIQVGKALNDPIKGITALSRVGVSFTKAQKDQIKGLVEAGQIYEAQGIILAELEREFMGAGLAAREAVPGSDAIDSWREFQEVVGEVVLRVIDAIEPMVVRVLDAFNNLSPGMQTFIVAAGAVAAAIGPLIWALGAFVGAVGNLAPIWASFVTIFTDAMVAAGITNIGVAIRALTAFLAPWIAGILLVVAALWEFRGVLVEAFDAIMAVVQGNVLPAFQNLFGKIGDLMGELSSGPLAEFVRTIMWLVAEVTGFLLQLAGVFAGRWISAIIDTVATAIGVVTDLVRIIEALLSGDLQGALDAAADLFSNFATGMLDALENILPGITGVVQAIAGAVQDYVGDRVAATLGWIEARFPGLVDAVAAMARGAVAWARNLYEGVKAWIADKLGPLIQWAKDRIRELNGLLNAVRRRQAAVAGEPAPAPTPAPPARPAPAPAPPAGDSGGGGGGGRSGRSQADRAAEQLVKATEKFEEALEGVNDSIDRAFDRNALPRSMQQAADLRRRIEELAEDARAAGVDMEAFAASMATTEQRIRDLELEGLAREAEDFRLEVRDLSDEVRAFGGGLPPLEQRLQDIDRAYEDLRREILEQIEANRVLADNNAEAAAAMAVLEGQLLDLETAYSRARSGAEALFAAQERLKDIQAAADAGDTQRAIRDLEQSRGDRGFMTREQQDLQKAEDDLQRSRIAAAEELAALEAEYLVAEAEGDTAQMARLQTQIDLQRRLYDLVRDTSAEQIMAHEQMQDALQRMVDGLAEGAAQLITDFRGGVQTIKKALAQMLIEFLQAQASKGITSIFSNFAGGFATGGRLRPGEWGIAGEAGPEPIYAGAAGLTVTSNKDAFGGGGAVYVDARGAGKREIDELRDMLMSMDRNFEGRVVAASNEGIMRGKIKPPSFG